MLDGTRSSCPSSWDDLCRRLVAADDVAMVHVHHVQAAADDKGLFDKVVSVLLLQGLVQLRVLQGFACQS